MEIKPTPAQGYCKRCDELFVYFRTGAAMRRYCNPCIEIDRQDAILFQRLQRRKAAVASGRRLTRFPAGALFGEAINA